jgi:membrane protein
MSDGYGASPPGATQAARRHLTQAGTRAWAYGNVVAERGRDWVERQDPATRRGAAIHWYRRFRESDGGLFTVLLAAYFFVTAIPATVVMVTYVYNDPAELANRLDRRLNLSGAVANLVDDVLTGASGHQLGAALIAVGDVLIFGMGFGRALQIVHARAWRIDLGKPQINDQARYFVTLLVPLGLLLLYIIQTKQLRGQPSWIGWLLLPGWIAVLLAYFVWLPRMLLHGRVSTRAVLPGAAFTLVGLVGLRLLSALLFRHWLEWYGKYYGSLGIVMALFFWIMLFGSLLILAAALAPALAQRRDLLEASARGVLAA